MSQSRYPGAKPFETHQQHIFFGRDEDTAKLYELIELEPLVVVYAKSGMGKSSLLNAGIIPKMIQAGEYAPLPVRFKAWTDGKVETPDRITRQTLTPNGSATTFLDTLIEDEPSLWHDLKERQIEGKKKVLLIFDQFEELFTYPKDAIQAFKEAVAEALYTKIPQRYRAILEEQIDKGTFKLTNEQYQLLQEPIDLRIVVAIRSDRMSLLNGLTDSLQTILKNLFELPPLSIEAAEKAILAPAHKPPTPEGRLDNGRLSTEGRLDRGRLSTEGDLDTPLWGRGEDFLSPPFDFEPQAVQKIIGFLTQNKTERIESTQLQIICQSVEKKVKTAGQIIRADELGDLNLVIENYYYDQLSQLGDAAAQLPARRFIEQGLIFEEEERRLSIYEGQIYKTYNLAPDTLKRLVDAHLLRAEPSLQGGYTYELSHDTLVAPILKAKNKRLEIEKQESDRLAAIEQARLQRIKEAQQQQELEEARATAAQERKRRQWATGLSIVSGVLFLLAATVGVYAWQQQKKAKDATADAIAQRDRAEKNRNEADSAKNVAIFEGLRSDSLGKVAVNEAEKAVTNFKLAEKRAVEAKRNADAATAARREAETNLTLANEQKGIATEALNQAKVNLQIAKDEEAKALAEKAKTQRALDEAQAANIRVVAAYLKDIDQHILKLEYDDALEKCQTALDLKVDNQKANISKRLFEIAYFYTETDTLEAAIKTIKLLDINVLPNRTALLAAIEKNAPPQYFVALEARYYPTMKPVEGGMFTMKDDTLDNKVRVNDYKMAETETTFFQYNLFAKATHHVIENPSWQFAGDNPAVNVSWYDAIEYGNWVSKKKGKTEVYDINKNKKDPNNDSYENLKWLVKTKEQAQGYRLPTEAEWEFAARGGNKTQGFEYSGDSVLNNVAWYYENSGSRTHAVATKKANELGLYDMSGNVWEWCFDWYGDRYNSNTVNNPIGAVKGTNRVIRGGSWFNDAVLCRSTYRSYYAPTYRYDYVGFRVVCMP
jgi:formylglycine-generating enzyme required for sulfatase activity